MQVLLFDSIKPVYLTCFTNSFATVTEICHTQNVGVNYSARR